MSENHSFFEKTLSGFIHEFANGDVIRKYVRKGYSIKEIKEHLDFPTPVAKIQEIAWKELLDQRIIFLERPGENLPERYEYIKDTNAFGKTSFRRVRIEEDNPQGKWKEEKYSPQLLKNLQGEGNYEIYVQIPFGLLRYRDPQAYKRLLLNLSEEDADFIDGIFAKRCLIYYKMNYRMEKILEQLYEKDFYQGLVYYLT